MTPLRRLATLVLLALTVVGFPAAASPRGDYYVMRHLQKAEGPDPGLTAEGRRNADRLLRLFASRPPRAIYVSPTRRAHETVAAVAARWKLVPKEYDPSDTPALLARVRSEPGPVLIVGHSNTVPDIVAGLGGTRPPPLGDGDYGDLWHVRGNPPRTTRSRVAAPAAGARN